jgi:hypothetical protein
MLLTFNGSYASSDGHPSTAAGMPQRPTTFGIPTTSRDCREVAVGVPFRAPRLFASAGCLFHRAWASRSLPLVPALVVRQGASHTVGRELRVSDYVVPAIVELRIAVQDADDFMPDHLQRLFFVG